jgi:ABC-type nitrate/sulfonate/bicarbonate transport system substrate-binding protein
MGGVQEGPVDHGGMMNYGSYRFSVLIMLLFTVALPVRVFGASSPQKAIFTFGGLNDRSGILFVARDAGIFQKHGLDATVVNVRNAQVGMSAFQT